MAIEEGSVVWLKSGSPSMTVEYIESKELIHVQWFEKHTLHEKSFYLNMLTEVNPFESANNILHTPTEQPS